MIAAAGTASCQLVEPRVICHNANCVEPTDPDRDDTLAALAASLRSEHAGRPVFDGIEIDLIWDAKEARCRFGHDFDRIEDAPDAAEALAMVSEHLERGAAATFDGGPFILDLEIKPPLSVEGAGDPVADAIACALDLAATLEQVGAVHGGLEVIIESSSPDILRTIAATPAWSVPRPAGVAYHLAATMTAPPPVGHDFHPIGDFDLSVLDVVTAHPRWLTDTTYQAYRSLELRLSLWMFSATSETLGAVQRFEPDYVVTSEALLVRRWLER